MFRIFDKFVFQKIVSFKESFHDLKKYFTLAPPYI
jgi:hypothetical protein